ncbi:MAG: peptidase S49 [Chelatococcus sp.]|nr:MAG: peptidase S49 [Chelatococcus sp.]
MIPYHRIAERLYSRPLLILPQTAHTVESFIRSRIRDGGDIEAGGRSGASNERSAETIEFFQSTRNEAGGQEAHSPRASRFIGSTPLDASGRPLPFRRTQDGTAIITMVGELVNRGAWIGASSGLVSYEGITHQLSAAVSDPMTRAILLDCESPGGEAVGAFECAAAVRKAAAAKPVIAIVNGMACSAMYAIASGATRIVTTPTGLSGSIGVVMMHLDYSELLADAGIKPTFIFAGDHKVDGNPYEPLPEAVRADFKRDIDAFYSLFLETVAAGRGARLTTDMARATQARVLMGAAAVSAGLADQVMTFDEVLASMADASFTRRGSSASLPTAQTQGPSMSNETEAPQDGTTTTTETNAAPAAIVTVADAAAAAGAVTATVQPAAPGNANASASPQAPSHDAMTAFRAQAAKIVSIGAQAARMGINVDVSAAIAKGMDPAALSMEVLEAAAKRDEASTVVATAPTPSTNGTNVKPAQSAAGESPIVAAAKQSAAALEAKRRA